VNKIFAVASYQSVGCTFLDWSIHYLSGQKQFYNVRQQWIPLSDNPVNSVNAHGHLKNHPRGLDHTKHCIDTLSNINGLASLYPVNMSYVDAAQALGITLDSSTTSEDFKKIVDATKNDFAQILEYISQRNIDLICVDLAPESALYCIQSRSSEGTILKNPGKNTHYSRDDQQKDFEDLFFKQSTNVWNDLGLTNTWDRREHLALCTRPFDVNLCSSSLVSKHLRIDSRLWWTVGEVVIKQVLDYLNMPLDQSRIGHWRSIYQEWQKPQLKSLEFVFNYQHIVDSILNNWYCDIDLTFEQEVVIQHCLIYQHNLNLKTWQLEKFPNNTQDLHKLLESNIHPLTS
jgi:hypothetical protein